MITRYVNKMLSSFRALHPKGIQMRGERRGACNLCEKQKWMTLLEIWAYRSVTLSNGSVFIVG